ncbi:MAG: hypothetical protein JO359_11775 [Candidatus Eremiobacteraeota bacterium]|nr:hypothetical protein [Candidatus Eremiobacteraeota bacterium]
MGRIVGLLLAAAAFIVVVPVAAGAKGTMRVQQADGSVQTYEDEAIKAGNKRLLITTADGKGTLLIERAACTMANKMLRCLPYSMTLQQNGKTRALDFQQGTVYINQTETKQHLPLSSTEVPPNGILMGISTKIGTFVSMTGTLDGKP